MNGDVQVLLAVTKPVRTSLTILYGKESDPHARGDLDGALRVLAAPEHTQRVRIRRETEVPPETITPAMVALVGCGDVAVPPLTEVMREGGPFATRVRRVLEHIGRRRTSGGERFVPGAEQPR